jgi:hypothetical protein
LIKQAGFEDQEFVGTTGFNTSPVTTGALFRARKRGLASLPEKKPPEPQAERKEEPIAGPEACSP